MFWSDETLRFWYSNNDGLHRNENKVKVIELLWNCVSRERVLRTFTVKYINKCNIF